MQKEIERNSQNLITEIKHTEFPKHTFLKHETSYDEKLSKEKQQSEPVPICIGICVKYLFEVWVFFAPIKSIYMYYEMRSLEEKNTSVICSHGKGSYGAGLEWDVV